MEADFSSVSYQTRFEEQSQLGSSVMTVYIFLALAGNDVFRPIRIVIGTKKALARIHRF